MKYTVKTKKRTASKARVSNSSNDSSVSDQNLQAMFGYDVSLVAKDLLKTAVISSSLILFLVFLAWYLPTGILSP